MSYYDHEARKWKRINPYDPYGHLPQEQQATGTATEWEEEDKPEYDKQEHLRTISKYKRKPKKTIRKICIECKKDYQAHKDSSKFCSPRCTLRHWRKRIK